jgi:kynurenine formamidase
MTKVEETVALLRSGRQFDLSVPLEPAMPVSPVHTPFRMALTSRHGDWVRDGGVTGATELLVLSGHTGTHIDALCHVARDGVMFGGLDAKEASVGGRFTALGVDTIVPIMTRGVLIDVPGYRGVDSADPGEPIGGDELEAVVAKTGVRPGRGDAVLVRTGWRTGGRYQDGPRFVGWETGVPGIDVSAADWLAAHGAVLVGADTIALEVIRPGDGHSKMPVHSKLLVDHGIHIVEMLDLDELAAARAYEVLLCITPLRIVGGTGSPIRAVAVSFDEAVG